MSARILEARARHDRIHAPKRIMKTIQIEGCRRRNAYDWLQAELGVSASIGTMFNTLRRLGLTLKKSASKRPSGHAATSPRHAACEIS